MALRQQLVRWDGFEGAPGYSVLYTSDVPGTPGAFNTFWTSIATHLPGGVTLTKPNTGRIIDEVTGKVTGVWTESTQMTFNGSGLGLWAAASGACITWHTGRFVNGKEVKGRTFIVPVCGNDYGTGGGLDQAKANAIQAAAQALKTALGTDLKVWARPYEGRAAQGTPGEPGYKPAIDPRPGSANPVTTTVCHTQGAVLRSRRD